MPMLSDIRGRSCSVWTYSYICPEISQRTSLTLSVMLRLEGCWTINIVIYLLELPPRPSNRHHQNYSMFIKFRLGNPNTNLHLSDWNPGWGADRTCWGHRLGGISTWCPLKLHINFESFHPPSWGRTAGRWMSSQWMSQVRLNCDMEVSLITGFRVSSTGPCHIHYVLGSKLLFFPYGRDGHQTYSVFCLPIIRISY